MEATKILKYLGVRVEDKIMFSQEFVQRVADKEIEEKTR